MSVAEVTIYSSSGNPTVHKKADCAWSLRMILPAVQDCRRTKKSTHVIAEARIDNGVTLRFISVDGDIELLEMRPMFGNSLKWLGFIPAPHKKERHEDVNDFDIHKIAARAFGAGAS